MSKFRTGQILVEVVGPAVVAAKIVGPVLVVVGGTFVVGVGLAAAVEESSFVVALEDEPPSHVV